MNTNESNFFSDVNYFFLLFDVKTKLSKSSHKKSQGIRPKKNTNKQKSHQKVSLKITGVLFKAHQTLFNPHKGFAAFRCIFAVSSLMFLLLINLFEALLFVFFSSLSFPQPLKMGASPKKPSPMKKVLKSLTDIPTYQRALRACFLEAKRVGAPSFNQTAKEFHVRRQSLVKYYRLLVREGLTKKDFDQRFLNEHFHHGHPYCITPAQRETLFSVYEVMDRMNAPLFNCEIKKVVTKMRANAKDTPVTEKLQPHHTTLKKIKCPPHLPSNQHIPTRRGRPTQGNEKREAKSQPQYLSSFYELLEEWMNKYNFQPSEM